MEVFAEESQQKGEEDLSKYMLDDLQLAAELGKTLLERNKELETLLKDHKHTIEEQEQEIVYLKKHTTALREVNDSRLKVYEQLEVGIQELERVNHRLHVENNADKKHIKTLGHNIETLEARCEELTKQLEECRQSLTVERRKNERLVTEKNKTGGHEVNAVKLKPIENSDTSGSNSDALAAGYQSNTTAPENCSFAFSPQASGNHANSTGISSAEGENTFDLSMVCSQEGNDEIIKLVNDLEITKRAFMAEQQRCSELEEQLVAIIQENQSLQSRIAQTSAPEEMRSMHDELLTLDIVKKGQMCARCLRSMDDRLTINDEQSSLAPTEECEEDEERSLLGMEVGDSQQHPAGDIDDNASEQSQAAYRSNMSIKAKKQISTTTTTPTTTKCPICSNINIKYLHEQIPISLDMVLLELWQKTVKRFSLLSWVAKMLQWPAIVISRMISSIPDDEDFSLLF